ncbi:MAG TPA: hypothetical protein VMN56_02560 [Casimicrobiaceae bacterium]|nr:hypothetical protein [Casimicrobiaceae bacterium]
MMVHDQYSGYVHEVPDHLMGTGLGEVVYDGFGNAVGWNPFSAISDAVTGAGNLVRGAVGSLAQGAGNIIGQAAQAPFNLVGQGVNAIGQGVNAAGQVIGSLVPGITGLPGMPGFVPPLPPSPFTPPGGSSMYPPYPYRPPFLGARPPWPTGWQHAHLPYTGLGPNRMYMRCAVWPGPKGLVPGYAANMPPGAIPGMPGFPGLPGPGGGRHRRHHRR